ncbi:MAG: hypothetical protein H7A23_01310 [Leptospiraceae bacterium]|nr:hypothetical protein [Leptospiraceae bacterium]
MSLDEFLDNLTLEEIDELKRLKLEKSKVYNFSKINDKTLELLFEIEKSFSNDIFNTWFLNEIKIQGDDEKFLNHLLEKEKNFISDYNEEDLKANFIIPILNSVDFKLIEQKVRGFYEELLSYGNKNFVLKGNCDFFVAKGLRSPKQPYFFIQEFKRAEEYSNPRPQLIAELICAVEINKFTHIKGAYIVGAIWNFVILKKLGDNRYEYYVSENFDSTKIENLKGIYKNLLFVKEEIKELAAR